MTQTKYLKSHDKPQTTPDTTGDLALAGSRLVQEPDAQKVSQIAKQFTGGSMANSELFQKMTTSYLDDEGFDGMGQAALTANVEYYAALCAKARKTHQEYLEALTFWQSKLDKISKTVD